MALLVNLCVIFSLDLSNNTVNIYYKNRLLWCTILIYAINLYVFNRITGNAVTSFFFCGQSNGKNSLYFVYFILKFISIGIIVYILCFSCFSSYQIFEFHLFIIMPLVKNVQILKSKYKVIFSMYIFTYFQLEIIKLLRFVYRV